MLRHKLATTPGERTSVAVSRICHILAALLAFIAAMHRTQTKRLRESQAPVRQGAKIIDAEFEVVGRRPRWRRLMTALTAVFWAAAIGFAIPQIWNFATQIGPLFAEG